MDETPDSDAGSDSGSSPDSGANRDSGPGRWRALVFFGLMMLGVVLIIEVISLSVLRVRGGDWWSPGRGAAERRQVTEKMQARLLKDQKLSQAKQRSYVVRGHVPHPFLGYVLDPAASETIGWKIDEFGFPDFQPPGGPAEKVEVFLFGGSVALGLAKAGRRTIIKHLEALPELEGRQVHLRGYALGGFKQPQQAAALNYLLAMGETPEIVINLDGFNDVALAPGLYKAQDLSIAYPRGWPEWMEASADADQLRAIGRTVELRHRRADAAKLCDGLPASPTCHLIWTLLDAQHGQRVAQANGEIDRRLRKRRSYRSHGPKRRHDETKIYRDLAELWKRSSLGMHAQSEALGIRYYHFLQPNQYVRKSKPMKRKERRIAIARDSAMGASAAKGYPRLAEAGEELIRRGVKFHDLRFVFSDVEEILYKDDCCHFNRRGNELLAEAIAAAVAGDLQARPPTWLFADGKPGSMGASESTVEEADGEVEQKSR